MKYATFAALVATVAAEQTCHTSETKWALYKDKHCKKVDKKLTKKFGKLRKEDAHMWSGDCETNHYNGHDLSVVVNCDADGFHEKVWKNKKCKGKPIAKMNYGWGKCKQAFGTSDTWVKMHSTADWDLTSLVVNKSGWNAWAQQHCVHFYEHYGFGGRHIKHCLGPNDPSNFRNLPANFFDGGWNDVVSSIKVGSAVKLSMYQHHIHQGRADTYNNGYQGPVSFNDQYSSARIVAADKAACVFEHFGQKGRQECYTYNENTGFGVYNLIPDNMNDKVSSINVPKGVVVRMWQHGLNQGRMDEYWGPVSANVAFNDQYSTIKVCRHHCN